MGLGRQGILLVIGALAALAAFAWSYAPTLASLVQLWLREPDYSHGFFVVPVALYFAWFRRASRPEVVLQLSLPSALLLSAAVGLRFLGARWNMLPLDAWSILAWAAGVAYICGGWPMLRWASPSIGFLWFMMPLPYRIEQALSLPLQSIATRLSCWTLQLLGQPAIAEGHVILLGNERLEIAQACSGLRILLGTVALGVVFAILTRHRWWDRLVLVACAIPVAVIANMARIVATGLTKTHAPGSWLANWSHDAGGHLMTAFSVLLFALCAWYLKQLFYDADELGAKSLLSSYEGLRPLATGGQTPWPRTDSVGRSVNSVKEAKKR